MGDGSAVGGWILTAAIITVLAGGVSAANGSGGSGRSGAGGGSGSGGSASATNTGTGNGTDRPAPPCTRVSTIKSADGARYHQFPVTADGYSGCGLRPGDKGRPVTIVQRALSLCSVRAVVVDGTYSDDTRGAIKRDQRRQLGPNPDGVYGPQTAKGMRWPWIDVSTNKFTGHCALAGEKSG